MVAAARCEGRSRKVDRDDPSALVPHGIVAGDEGARIVAIVVPRRDRPDDITIAEGE